MNVYSYLGGPEETPKLVETVGIKPLPFRPVFYDLAFEGIKFGIQGSRKNPTSAAGSSGWW